MMVNLDNLWPLPVVFKILLFPFLAEGKQSKEMASEKAPGTPYLQGEHQLWAIVKQWWPC